MLNPWAVKSRRLDATGEEGDEQGGVALSSEAVLLQPQPMCWHHKTGISGDSYCSRWPTALLILIDERCCCQAQDDLGAVVDGRGNCLLRVRVWVRGICAASTTL